MSDLVIHFVLFVVAGSAVVLVPLLIGRLVRPTKPTPEKDAIYECGEPTIGSSYIQFDLRFYTVALLFIIFDVEVAFFFPWATMYGGAMQLADNELSPPARVELTKKILNVPKADGVDSEALKNAYKILGARLNSDEFAAEVKQTLTADLRTEAESDVRQAAADEGGEAVSDEDFDAAVAAALVPLVDAKLDAAHDDAVVAELARAVDVTPAELKANWVSAAEARQLGLVSFADIFVFFAVLLVGFAYVWKRGDLEWVRAVGNTAGRRADSGTTTPTQADAELVA